MQNYHKKYLFLTILFAFLMFVWVIAAVLFTGGKDISDFTEQDRLFFILFAAAELLNLFLLFLFGKKARTDYFLIRLEHFTKICYLNRVLVNTRKG